jgi:hypothetical protein
VAITIGPRNPITLAADVVVISGVADFRSEVERNEFLAIIRQPIAVGVGSLTIEAVV